MLLQITIFSHVGPLRAAFREKFEKRSTKMFDNYSFSSSPPTLSLQKWAFINDALQEGGGGHHFVPL